MGDTVAAATGVGSATLWGGAIAIGLIATAGWLGFAVGASRRKKSATGQTGCKSQNSHGAAQDCPEIHRKNNGDGVSLRATDSQLNLTEVIHQSAEAIIVTDTEFKIRYANPAVTTILGYAPQNLSGKKVDLLISKINERATLEDMSLARSKGLHWSGRVIGKKVDGVPLEMEMDISPIRDAENKIVAFTHLMYDISMKTQLEEQVRQSMKMQAVGRLAGGIAHDFNNHLTVIKGYCDLLMQEAQQDDSSLDCIEQISWATKQATKLTGSLLAFSRKKVLKPSLLNPADALAEMEKPLAVLGEDITLTIKTPENSGSICVDTVRFQQTVMNLATNARDAMGGAGQLTIELSNVELDRDHARSHPDTKSGRHVLMSFTDTGAGMDSETLTHVFEPFFTTKSKGKGTGLGLAMVYSFVKQSGGHIDISSEKGTGTTFRLYIPQAKSTAEEGTEIMDTHPTKKQPRRILLVEDDHAVRRLVARVLVEDGYSVVETGDPTEAAGLMRQSSQPIDLLVSDVVMPEMNGPEMAAQLRQTDPNLKVLFMSGFSEETVISQGVPSNMEHFLHKPFTPQQICKKIADVLTESSATPQGTYESETSLQQTR
ncbi:MAG: response regulator [Phycisphaerae bacterium]|nr:response regulator [Phycisphaerae bacterium]